MLLSVAVILPVVVFAHHFYQLSIGESDDKICKDGIKSIMNYDAKGEL